MSVVRITKEFHFEAAHALYGHEGPCRNIHGHSYRLRVCVKGKVCRNPGRPGDGMVIDFSTLQQIIQSDVIEEFDHALLLHARSPHKIITDNPSLAGKVRLLNCQPTCENLLLTFAERIKSLLPGNLRLHHLFLRETATSFAEWHAEDND